MKPSITSDYSILFYARFRDDILLVVNANLDVTRDLINRMKREASPFVLTIDSVSKHGFQMLDVEGTLRVDGLLEFSLFQKTTSIWKPLSPESVHPPSIHMHWPLAQCRRIFRRFSDPRKGRAAVDLFRGKYKASFGVELKVLHLQRAGHKSLQPKHKTSWLVLPFHRCLSRKVGHAVASLSVPRSMPFEKVGLAWSLNSRHLAHRLRRKRLCE